MIDSHLSGTLFWEIHQLNREGMSITQTLDMRSCWEFDFSPTSNHGKKPNSKTKHTVGKAHMLQALHDITANNFITINASRTQEITSPYRHPRESFRP
jgi:hypothetical protein